MYETLRTDVLVIGGGAAGVRAAIAVAEKGLSVMCLSKAPISRSGITPVAGEGIEAAVAPGDSPRHHYEDTVKAGRGLADEVLVNAMAQEATPRIEDLLSYGTRFKKNPDGTLAQSPRPGQKHARNLFLMGGGWGLMASLFRKAGSLPGLVIREDTQVLRLVTSGSRVAGAVVLDVRTGAVFGVEAKATILASGGYEELWPVTDCPPECTGEAMLMAARLGGELIDLEMVLYYPTVIVFPLAARGWMVQYEYIINPDILGGRLINVHGEQFVKGFPARDELIMAINREIAEGRGTAHGGVYADLTNSPYGREELTRRMEAWLNQFRNLRQVGIDLRDQMVEMAPAAHYCLGGIGIDEYGRTGMEGLWAAGEVTGNVHGANRLSGNALTETQVFGYRAAADAVAWAAGQDWPGGDFQAGVAEEIKNIARWTSAREGLRPIQLKRRLQEIMGKWVAFDRNETFLKNALAALDELEPELAKLRVDGHRRYCQEVREAHEVLHMIPLARAVIAAGLERKESRGHHMRADYPGLLPEARHTVIKLAGGISVSSRPVRKLAHSGGCV
ncbi:MAG: FAD-binding protein [Bacillota bacterium]